MKYQNQFSAKKPKQPEKPKPQQQVVSSAMAVYLNSSSQNKYSFGAKGILIHHSKSKSPPKLSEQELPWRKKKQTLQPQPKPIDEAVFFSSFKSVSSPPPITNITKPMMSQMNAYYHMINAQQRISQIQNIQGLPRQGIILNFVSGVGLMPPTAQQFATKAGLYSMKFTNDFEKDTCEAITHQMSNQSRKALKSKPIQEQVGENVIDLKEMGFDAYSEAILEEKPNILFLSIMKSFGSLSVDQMINLPEKYEVKERKNVKSIEINTDGMLFQGKHKQLPISRNWEILKLEIDREKSRKDRPKDYAHILQSKLLELLDYVLQGDPVYNGLDYHSKLRVLVKDIQKFKGKTIDGELKINILLFIFRQSKALKEYIDKQKIRAEPQPKKQQPSPPQTLPKRAKPTKDPVPRQGIEPPQPPAPIKTANRKAASDKAGDSRVEAPDDDSMWIGSR